MDDDDRASIRPRANVSDAAARLAGESLDSYSFEELDTRIGLLEAEIARVRAHRDRTRAHRSAAEALFRPKSG